MNLHRRQWLRGLAAGALAAAARGAPAGEASRPAPLKVTGMRVTPVALPDPPLLFAGGCHGPYFLRNVVELTTDGGAVGVAETAGGEANTAALGRAKELVVGRDAFAYRSLQKELSGLGPACYAGVEVACLDACGRALGRRVCDLLGGPVRDSVEFSAYLFYRYAADHPVVLDDPRIKDSRGRGGRALDQWGEVRTPDAMADAASAFRDRWGFRVFKLKAGVLTPDLELATMRALAERLGPGAPLRIDPNARWRTGTAVRVGKALGGLNLDYYEDPVPGQRDMALVRGATGLRMSTNMCVTSFGHVPEALRLRPIDVLLADLHYFGGFAGNLALGPVADAAGWSLGQHSNNHAGLTMAAMTHLGATLPQLTSAGDTHYPWLPEDADLIEGPKLPILEGKVRVPEGPGLGVTLDRDRLARAHEAYQKCGMRGRDDAPLMRRLEPGWTGGPL